MTVWCIHCEKWSEIPADLVSSETLLVPAPIAVRTINWRAVTALSCPECWRYHRIDMRCAPSFGGSCDAGAWVSPASASHGAIQQMYAGQLRGGEARKRGDEIVSLAVSSLSDYRDTGRAREGRLSQDGGVRKMAPTTGGCGGIEWRSQPRQLLVLLRAEKKGAILIWLICRQNEPTRKERTTAKRAVTGTEMEWGTAADTVAAGHATQ